MLIRGKRNKDKAMITTLIILAYVANVFLNRGLNKKLNDLDFIDAIPFLWFFPLFSTIAFLYHLIKETSGETNNKAYNWLTGKHWNK